MDALHKKFISLASFSFDLLQAVAAVLGLLAVFVLVIAILRSIWSVTMGKATLVVPFRGAEKLGVWVSGILAQQLDEIERVWQELSQRVRVEREPGTSSGSPMLVDLGRSKPDTTLDQEQEHLISSDPMEGQAIGRINLGPISFSPESLFVLSYQVRTVLARRTIRGAVDQFGDTIRLSTTFTSRKGPITTVLVRRAAQSSQLMDLIDDMAFHVAKHRLGLKSEARTWGGYRAFMEGYAHHLRYERTGDISERDIAIQLYEQSVALEPDYHLAHYNLGALLYGRYTATDNAQAIEHVRYASGTLQPALRAMALSVLARTYCQQTWRYGHEEEPWLSLAEEASYKAVLIGEALKETWLARGFALQARKQSREAIEAYQRVIALPGDSSADRILTSIALNNVGFIHMTMFRDFDEAEKLFRRALEFNRQNKMPHANLGEIYKRQTRYDDALNELRRAVTIDPRYVNGHNEMGMVFLAMARDVPDAARRAECLKQARECHERAVALVPKQEHRHRAEVHRRFAEACQEYGFLEEAREEKAEVDALTRLIEAR
jgi:tetratricopeptide (TPR) repeat protein